jgi:AraC-like DNA-binding protein
MSSIIVESVSEQDINGPVYEEESPDTVREQDMLLFVRNFTLRNLQRAFRLEELAREYGLSSSGFSHSFQSVTGITPMAYANRVRMEEALRLLRSTRLSIKEIASMLGFTTSDYFCKSFRRHHLMSPGSYRNTHLQVILSQQTGTSNDRVASAEYSCIV